MPQPLILASTSPTRLAMLRAAGLDPTPIAPRVDEATIRDALTAEGASPRDIADALFRYGEEKNSRRIAKFIVAARAEAPIERTAQLAAVVAKALGGGGWMAKHPATRTFQGLRIVVNRELQDIESGLEGAAMKLKTGGRLAVISFHSLEDRITKRFMRGDAERVPVRRGLPPAPEVALRFRVIGKPVTAGDAELAANPRSRSAVLRVAERVR